MPRYPTQSSLPPLAKVLPEFDTLAPSLPKVQQVADLLRNVALQHRSTRNLTFYSSREIASFFGVSQDTAACAIRRLDDEGLLKRVRGTHTLLLGKEVIARAPHIRAVTGLLLWVFAQRFSEVHGNLTRRLAERLWPHNIVLEIIPHYDIGDNRPDLDERLKLHSLDFTLWPFPFAHHKEHLLRLQDRGIRNLIIGVGGVRTSYQPQVIVDFMSAYTELLRYWQQQGIRRILVIQPCEFPPRRRLELFEKIALDMGFECETTPSSYSLPAELLAREKPRIGIALLDEHSTTEFVSYDPPAFIELARRHRILFGNGSYNISFAPAGMLRVDRIFIPTHRYLEGGQVDLITAITQTLVQWTVGNFNAPPITVPAFVATDVEVPRYL